MTSGAEEQAVRAKSLHREVNERILEVATALFEVGGHERVWLVCECSSATCSTRLEVEVDAFRALLARPGCFVLLAGHQQDGVERVVEDGDGYVVVEKLAAPGAGR